MKKYFNTAGPCHPDEHYMLPADGRCKNLSEFIDQKQYFVLHAARQSGKTTLLLDMVKQLNDSGNYYAMYCSLESVQGITDVERGLPAIVRSLTKEIEFNENLKNYSFAENADYSDFNNVLVKSLAHFCKKLDKPLVILFDEADCLSDKTLISFLRQLRDGYVNRNRIPFVHSLCLTGMRNIRDYKVLVREEEKSLGSTSPFNIVSEAFTLRNFTGHETAQLYRQHTEQTGQEFTDKVLEKAQYYTWGQPWLVNAIAREIVVKILKSDFSKKILPEHVDQAVQNIIYRRDTHIDSLLERLKEKRVQKIIEPVLIGQDKGFNPADDDFQYVMDLGLIKNDAGVIKPSNPIYSEVIIRSLSSATQMAMDSSGYPPAAPAYIENNRLDMKKLLMDFQQFWRENSKIWTDRYQYKEAAPHLILMAFLQRIINQGGQIIREPALGRQRLDLCINYKNIRYPVELKLRYGTKTLKEGTGQLADYMDTLGCNEGWLIIFDRRKSISWKKKIFWKTETSEKGQIHIAGC
ncbi:NTP hydrolase p-loop-containing [Desulfonema limicola]|uniref:NTP hydrolase p-loop-containing n=1 Tax=Desulfonema limicola TaxID=45656 RepID=A0A975B371_9BACT|nr:AAA-like domain-containing protein [Desulfonema limicola]QTA77941.1 NTP hydrolase p-loop-containing [Desulfonema limicola]